MINILMLMAGEGKAFREKEYTFPKTLVEINGKPMIQVVLESMHFNEPHQFIFVIRKEDDVRYNLGTVLKLLANNSKTIVVEKPTAGAACSALLATEEINNDNPLIVANADQVLEKSVNEIYCEFKSMKLDGGIVTFESVHPRWSYVRIGDNGLVVETAEKRPISRDATVGVYYFKSGKYFISAAMEMIKKDASIDGQYYICPAYNELILELKKIGVYKISTEEFHSLGSPEDVVEYENLLKLKKRETKTL